MNDDDEETRITKNQQGIRDYLMGQFTGFELTEDRAVRNDCHRFTVSKPTPPEQYKLKATWPKISDGDNTPEKNKRLLVTEGVADKMRAAKGKYFTWGKY